MIINCEFVFGFVLDSVTIFASTITANINFIHVLNDTNFMNWKENVMIVFGCMNLDLAFLKEIAEKSQTVCFSPEEEGGIRVHIFINYFEELMSAEHKSYIEYNAIMQDKKLSELLGIPELSDEEKELALKMKGILDRIDEETRIDRATAFRAVLDKMAKEPEENWSLHYMATLLEALLYFMLNEGNEKIDEEEHNEQ